MLKASLLSRRYFVTFVAVCKKLYHQVSQYEKMNTFKKISTITGWAVFAIALIVYYLSAERTGSLWDCGEFILGAYKLQVVHPPGAPLFLLVGRLFTWIAEIFSNNPADIAFAVNLMNGMCTAMAAAFVAWITITFARLATIGRDKEVPDNQIWPICGAGLVAGLATAFCTSVWFSAVEGEVYAMSTLFTAMTLWSMVKWYGLPDDPKNDKWIVFALYSAGLSIGVHLLSLLTFPALALLYYFKKYKNPTFLGFVAAAGIGALIIPIIQKVVIVGIPALWGSMELFMVNSLGLPFHTGLIPTLLIIFAAMYLGLRYAHKRENGLLQRIIVAAGLVAVSFSTIGVVVVRANAATPINMNAPSDAMRLIPYLNREQYGERPLLRGNSFEAQPYDTEKTPRYGQVGDRYEIVDQKLSYKYKDEDMRFLPRIGHNDTNRPALYKQWMDYMGYDKNKPPTGAFNIAFMLKYQFGWMYWRYFNWNFVGRQNGEQGFYKWNPKSGNWLSGIKFLDSKRLYNQNQLPETIKNHRARNTYYFLPLIFGLIGMIFHFKQKKKDFLTLLVLFLLTGFGIIMYSNQPPNEPRERDYVLVGSFLTFCIWIGLSVPAIYELIAQRIKGNKMVPGLIATALVLSAPLIMGFQNFDDHDRSEHYASRDYASNFLESCDPNSIIFTYGDNDTYPLWYAQEVEGIRTDVRVVNLSLIAVDWYINGLRRKVNDSPEIKFTIPAEKYRGDKRNQLYQLSDRNPLTPLDQALKYMGEDHPFTVPNTTTTFQSDLPSRALFIPIDVNRARQSGLVEPTDTNIVSRIPVTIPRSYITKDQLAVLDIIMSNLYDRSIYFSVTCREDKLLGMQDYMQMEGMGLKIIPVKSDSETDFFYIYGSGRMNVEETYDRIMNKWKWGNFDKHEAFVDYSYGASIQAMKMIFWRLSETLLRQGDTERAVKLTEKYFSAFPHFNFPYDGRTFPHINVFVRAGATEQAQHHMRILANELADFMQFYDSLSEEDLQAGFNLDHTLTTRTIAQIIASAQLMGDEEFTNEMNGILGQYNTQAIRD